MKRSLFRVVPVLALSLLGACQAADEAAPSSAPQADEGERGYAAEPPPAAESGALPEHGAGPERARGARVGAGRGGASERDAARDRPPGEDGDSR